MKVKSLILVSAISLLFVTCQTPTAPSSGNADTPIISTWVTTDSTGQPTVAEEKTSEMAATSPSQPIGQGITAPAQLPQDVPTVSVDKSVVAQPEPNEALADLPTDVALLYKGLSPKSQEFDLQGHEVKRLECRGGTVILVNPKAFEYEDGTPLPEWASVTLKVTEYLKRSDMLLSPLTTTTQDGKTLETGGMVYSYAFANSKRCRLKKDSVMRVGFKVVDDDRFQLFDGSTGPSNLIEWSLAPEPLPVSVVTHNVVDKRPQFSRGKLEEYIVKNISRTPAMRKYKAEGFIICALVTVDKQGKVVHQRLAENKDVFRDMGIDTAFLGMIKRMPLWMPALKKGKPVRSRAMIVCHFSGFRDESASIKLVSSDEYASSMKLSVNSMLSMVDDDLLTFPVKRLGWINCDRFYNDTRPKAQLLVDAAGQNADVKLIFKKINAIMSVSRIQANQFKSADIPVGESVYVVGVRKEGTQFYFGMQETTADNKTIALSFSPVSDAELKEKLKVLNN